MLIPDNIKVHLYCGVTDMRKSINTLAIRVRDVLQMAPTNGHLFLFRSRGGDKLKALYYEEHGFCCGMGVLIKVNLFSHVIFMVISS